MITQCPAHKNRRGSHKMGHQATQQGCRQAAKQVKVTPQNKTVCHGNILAECSRGPTWQTFFALATSWQIIVFLYLRQTSRHTTGLKATVAVPAGTSNLSGTSPGIVSWSPSEDGIRSARDMALSTVLNLQTHAQVAAEQTYDARALPAQSCRFSLQ